MTDWFFYQERGKTMGPVTAEDLRQRVRDGDLRAFDLIYKEGESGWKMAMEHPDLREAFREAGQNVVKGRPWVCLRRKGDQSFDFVTDGPFSDDEVRTALASGRLGYGDYVWRNEFAEWQRIGSLELFNPRAKPVREATVTEVRAEDLLKNVVEFKRAPAASPAPPPPKPAEADGDDLLATAPRTRPRPPSEEETRVIMRRPLATGEDGDGDAEDAGPPPPPPSSVTNEASPAAPDVQAATPSAFDGDGPTVFVPRRTVDASGAAAKTHVPTGRLIVHRPGATKTGNQTKSDGTTKKKKTRARAAEPPPAPEPASPPPSPSRAATPRPVAAEPGPAIFFEGRSSRRPERSPFADWGIVLALVAVLAGGIGWLLTKHRARFEPGRAAPVATSAPPPAPVLTVTPVPLPTEVAAPLPAPEPAAVVAAAPEPAADLAPEPAPAAPEPAPAPASPTEARAPSELRLSITTSADGKARIDVRSDASQGVPVYVQVVGLPGQVASGAASYRFVRADSRGSLGKPVDLSSIELPPGRYHVVAESGTLRRETTLNLGVAESRGRQAVARQRKLGAGALWSERLRLLRVNQQVSEALTSSGVGKRLGPRAFAVLDGVTRSTGARYLFFEDWVELKTIVQGGRARVTNDLVARAKRARDRVAAFSVYRK